MPKFIMTELVNDYNQIETARMGAGSGAGNNITDAEVGKFMKLVAESRYDNCAVGNEIEGRLAVLETATQDAFSIGGVQRNGRFECTFDGLQATPGTGTVTLGSYVVAGTPVAKGTALATNVPARVCLATAAATAIVHKWRVVSLGSAGTGAVGTTGLIEKV